VKGERKEEGNLSTSVLFSSLTPTSTHRSDPHFHSDHSHSDSHSHSNSHSDSHTDSHSASTLAHTLTTPTPTLTPALSPTRTPAHNTLLLVFPPLPLALSLRLLRLFPPIPLRFSLLFLFLRLLPLPRVVGAVLGTCSPFQAKGQFGARAPSPQSAGFRAKTLPPSLRVPRRPAPSLPGVRRRSTRLRGPSDRLPGKGS